MLAVLLIRLLVRSEFRMKNAEETNIQLAEAFWESDSFKDWADEEVREHGDVSFGDWADQEFSEASHKGSDPLLFEDWVRHEESEMAHQAESFEAEVDIQHIKDLGKSFDDDDGLPEDTYSATWSLINEGMGPNTANKWSRAVDATDGKFYLQEPYDFGLPPYDAESFEADECGCGDEMVMEAESFEGETEVFCASCGGRRRDAEFELHDWYDPMSDYGMMNTNPVIQEQRDEFFEEMDNQRESYNKAKKQEMAIERRMRNINRAVRNEKADATSPLSRRMPIAAGAKGSAGGMVPNYIKYGLGALVVYAGYKVASNK